MVGRQALALLVGVRILLSQVFSPREEDKGEKQKRAKLGHIKRQSYSH